MGREGREVKTLLKAKFGSDDGVDVWIELRLMRGLSAVLVEV